MTDRLTWTDQPPTEPGWYWHQYPDRQKPAKVHALYKWEGEICVNPHNGSPGTKAEEYGGQWAGPIPQPV